MATRTTPATNEGYARFLKSVKDRIAGARLAAARSVNRELIGLYWWMGQEIVRKQRTHGWGDAVVERLSRDLLHAFPDMRGLSPQNLWRTRQFHLDHTGPAFLEAACAHFARSGEKKLSQAVREMRSASKRKRARAILSQAVRELLEAVPWGHHTNVLASVKDPQARLWYLQNTCAFGWSRNVLAVQVGARTYERTRTKGKLNNFRSTLPASLADLADEVFKSDYNLEFIGVKRAVKERELEARLVERVQRFILELGYGFCFIGRQHTLKVSSKEFRVDLLFYHRFLRCLVAIDLKLGEFEPDHTGKMDFYLNVLNDRERASGDNPSIGIILCGKKDGVVVEYSLRGRTNPIGVAAYKYRMSLPEELKGKLPSAKQLRDAVREALREE